ncbi:aldo/keto reductase [Rubrobacter aplysinae]|uniref:aldo/keto reductase n=1 Tax=Rubrobacter aplysinae TaxID=909625 RepID=UPI00064BC443|nr:aldo/keto reductase [Rubrobacter aplysinae]
MEYRRLGRTGLMVSELCLGTMTFGNEADEETSKGITDRFVEAGGNFVDTANVYSRGVSEEITGRAIENHDREDIVLATKFRFPMGDGPNDSGASRKHVIAACEASLKRLGTDYIDLYQIHCWDAHTPIEETLSALDDLVQSGKVRYIGASNFTGWQLEKSIRVSEREGLAHFDCLQPQYSLIVRDIEREVLPVCREEGLGVIPWSPLAGGFLTGKYSREDAPPEDTRMASWTDTWERHATPEKFDVVDRVREIAEDRGKEPAQVALNWVKDRPGVTAPIIGARSLDQLEKNLAATGWSLSEGELDSLEETATLPYAYPYNMIARANA